MENSIEQIARGLFWHYRLLDRERQYVLNVISAHFYSGKIEDFGTAFQVALHMFLEWAAVNDNARGRSLLLDELTQELLDQAQVALDHRYLMRLLIHSRRLVVESQELEECERELEALARTMEPK